MALILILIFLIGCNAKKADKLFINHNFKFSENEYAIIFYHDGDCSYCYSVLDDLDKSFPNALIVSVTSLKDVNLINYQLERFSFKGLSIIDSSGSFYSNNKELLSKDRLFVLNNKREIILKEPEYNLNTKQVIKKYISE